MVSTGVPELDGLPLAELERLAVSSADRWVRRRAASKAKARREAGEVETKGLPATPKPRQGQLRTEGDGS
jgi:hypothetical protein